MKEPREKPIVDFTSINANAFSIMGAVVKALRKEGADKEYCDKYRKEAQSGDYDHLLQVSMKYCEVC